MLYRNNSGQELYPYTLQPRSGRELLPVWTPEVPRGGWTLSAAREAAQDYAHALLGRVDLPPTPRLEKCAYLSLLCTVPDLHRADLVARLAIPDSQQP